MASPPPSPPCVVPDASRSDPCEESEGACTGPFGPVAGPETLLRLVYAPEMIDQSTGRLLETVFSRTEMENGLSLLRAHKVDEAEIQRQAGRIEARKSGRRVIRRLASAAVAIRDIDDPLGKQAICVLADGDDDNPGHASGKCAAPKPAKSELRRLRRLLFEAFGQVPP